MAQVIIKLCTCDVASYHARGSSKLRWWWQYWNCLSANPPRPPWTSSVFFRYQWGVQILQSQHKINQWWNLHEKKKMDAKFYNWARILGKTKWLRCQILIFNLTKPKKMIPSQGFMNWNFKWMKIVEFVNSKIDQTFLIYIIFKTILKFSHVKSYKSYLIAPHLINMVAIIWCQNKNESGSSRNVSNVLIKFMTTASFAPIFSAVCNVFDTILKKPIKTID